MCDQEELMFQDIEYPSPFVIKNTFIAKPPDRPNSLDEFLKERRTTSCPGSGIAGCGDTGGTGDDDLLVAVALAQAAAVANAKDDSPQSQRSTPQQPHLDVPRTPSGSSQGSCHLGVHRESTWDPPPAPRIMTGDVDALPFEAPRVLTGDVDALPAPRILTGDVDALPCTSDTSAWHSRAQESLTAGGFQPAAGYYEAGRPGPGPYTQKVPCVVMQQGPFVQGGWCNTAFRAASIDSVAAPRASQPFVAPIAETGGTCGGGGPFGAGSQVNDDKPPGIFHAISSLLSRATDSDVSPGPQSQSANLPPWLAAKPQPSKATNPRFRNPRIPPNNGNFEASPRFSSVGAASAKPQLQSSHRTPGPGAQAWGPCLVSSKLLAQPPSRPPRLDDIQQGSDMPPPPPPPVVQHQQYSHQQSSYESCSDEGSDKAVIKLTDALKVPTLGLNDLPSLGSVAHRLGGCRPCAFYHKRGCENAESCPFCHLCPPWEKKVRLREKRAAKREAKEAKSQALFSAHTDCADALQDQEDLSSTQRDDFGSCGSD